MFIVNDDNSIYVTRGDIVVLGITAEYDGKPYIFKAGDLLRIKVFGKKDCENVVLQKDFPIPTATDTVEIFLDENDTKIGGVISKPVDYWYEVELNPLSDPQTIIGYDDEGTKVFRLFPEGRDLTEYIPDITPEDIPVVDEELDLSSTRPLENRVIARAIARLDGALKCVPTYVTPEMFGAIGDGVTDDTNAIQNAINYCTAFSTLYLRNATYCISAPIELNKKVNIVGQKTVFKATKEMDCVVHMTNQGSLNPYTVSQLTADANNLATVGFKIGGSGDTTQITFSECVAQNAKSHGFCLLPVAYIINFVNCFASNNGGDGLNAVANGSDDQINVVRIEKCSFLSNAESGVNVNGVSFSVSGCVSEFNKYGISVGGVDYVTYGVHIQNCHFEKNKIASVYVNTLSVATVTVKNCYFNQETYDESIGATAFIKCTPSSYETTLCVEGNIFEGNTKLYCVDGANKLNATSTICVENISRLVNTQNANIDSYDTKEKYLPIPMTLAYGAGCSDCGTSVNLVGANPNTIKMIVPHNLVNALPRLVGAYVATDGTTARIRCYVKVYNSKDKSILGQTDFSQIVSKTGLYSFNLLNNWGYKRIENNSFMELMFVVEDKGNATSVILSDIHITAYL